MRNEVQSVSYVGHETDWRRRVVDLTSEQLLHVAGAFVATWEPIEFKDLAEDCVFVADDLCVVFSINLADPIEQFRYEKALKAYDPKTCDCSGCEHYRRLLKHVGKDRMPAAGVGCNRVPVEPMKYWWRVFVRENLIGAAYVKMWDRSRGEYHTKWFRFTGCKHAYSHSTPYRCYHVYSCPTCGHQYSVDSSD